MSSNRSSRRRSAQPSINPAQRAVSPRLAQGAALAILMSTGLLSAGGLASGAALAQGTPPAAGQSPGPSATQTQDEVLLTADQVTFDEAAGIVTATGNVELSQGIRNVRADKITYNRNSKIVVASGNIRIVDPAGEVMFADYAELTDSLRDAFVENIRILMTDNSRLAGNEAERIEGQLTRVNRAVYSPCELCKEDPTRPPLWQLRAVRVVHDAERKEVRYKDAVLEMFGIPIAYTPYLSHPDPTVERQSGLLTPVLGNSSELGAFLRARYYLDIAPDQDATFELGAFSEQGLLLGGQYRKRFENGRLQLDGAITRGDLPKIDGRTLEDKWRGYIAARGLFDLNETWRAGFDVMRASDRSYLRRYHDYREDVLTSRAYVEGFRDRNYAVMNVYSFQDLRFGNSVPEPIAVPSGRWQAFGDPAGFLGGRWSMDSSILALTRPGNGPNSRRVSFQPGWEREMISNFGLVTNLSGSVLMAGYQADNFNYADPTLRGNQNSNRLRFFPQVQATMRYPFVRYGEESQQLVEPILQFTAAPKISNDSPFPNEDSIDLEFDDMNLLMANRFTGIDRLDGGSRVTYGLRTAYYGDSGARASLFFGQSRRLVESSDMPVGSGLEKKTSDYVGRLSLSPAQWLDLDYSFRYDEDSLKPRRHSVNLTAGVPAFNVNTSYTFLDQTAPRYGTNGDKVEQMTIGFGSRLNDYWSLNLAHVQSMQPDPGARASMGVLTYQDECLTFQAIARRDYTYSIGDERDGTTLFFRFVFKNIGEISTPAINANVLGSSSPRN